MGWVSERKKMISLTKTPTCMKGKYKHVLNLIEKVAHKHIDQEEESRGTVYKQLWDEECYRAIKIRKE